MNEIEPEQGLDCVRIKFQMRLYLEQELAVDQTLPPHQGTIQRGIPRWGDQGVFFCIFLVQCSVTIPNLLFYLLGNSLYSKNLIE